MNTLEHVRKLLTEKEFMGYLKGSIAAIRFEFNLNMTAETIYQGLERSQYYEIVLKQMEKEIAKRNALRVEGGQS